MKPGPRADTPISLCLVNFHLLTMVADRGSFGLIKNGAVAIADGQIVDVGETRELGKKYFARARQTVDGEGRYLSPGLIDCHTHLIWGGSRVKEWRMRLEGASYEEIARRGGGILSTVAATRSTSAEELLAGARKRLKRLMDEGVTSVEIKSGYGLDLENELKMLKVAARLRDSANIDVFATLLAAHAVPPEFRGKADEYVDLVCDEIIPAAAESCQAVDVFCDRIAFDWPQTERVFQAARRHSLALKIHAEQLSNLGAARRAAEMGALSADHLEYLDEAGVKALSRNGTVAVLLPGAFYFLRETQRPPIELLRQFGVPMAVASDANPGSSPVGSLLLMMNMACLLFGLTPEESLAGVTRHAAAALGWSDRLGLIAPGMQADLVEWEIGSPSELAWGVGHNPCRTVYKRGQAIRNPD